MNPADTMVAMETRESDKPMLCDSADLSGPVGPTGAFELSPAQAAALRGVQRGLQLNNLVCLWGDSGLGRTSILRELQRLQGGVLVNVSQWLRDMGERHPLALEEAFERLVRTALEQSPLVLLDDVDLVCNVLSGCGYYPRSNLFEVAGKAVADLTAGTGKQIVFTGNAPSSVRQQAYLFGISDFDAADYAHITRAWLPPALAERLDFPKIHRFACGLDAWQLTRAARWLASDDDLTTDRYIDYLRAQGLWSNVDLAEVRQVTLRDLIGIDDVIEKLETHVVLPLENDELAMRYGLRPARGVLLLGPPGTGKTTVGRALAHRLKGKFFRIDGTFIPGTDSFYYRVQRVFSEAVDNAPAVIFIDDCDAIFEEGREQGLYRYLLTMLDGLQSESAGRVCVIMTAMKLGDLPPALVRSGRIELWLETRLPDADGRRTILQKLLSGLPEAFAGVDVDRLVFLTEGMTGADIGPVIQDGKNLFAFDELHGRPLRPATDYFVSSIESILANKRRYQIENVPPGNG